MAQPKRVTILQSYGVAFKPWSEYAKALVFRIPPSSMTAMMAHLRERKLGLAAQVHSHPNRAFHSRADDAWAIVRHRAGSPDIFKMLSAPRASLEGEQ